jgi:hypothetical protein
MTDLWPSQDGCIIEGFSIANCYCTQGVTEGYAVTSHGCAGVTAHQIPIDVSNAVGDGIGIALKTGVAGETIPVLFYGVYKMDTDKVCAIGAFVTNSSGGQYASYLGATHTYAKLMVGAGASYVLGMALQTAAAGDEILILVGKTS